MTILEMDEPTAMRRAYKENVEREALSVMDEANWFFTMLGLKDEQLWIAEVHSGGGSGSPETPSSLPQEKNPIVKALASDLGVSPQRIADRLPLRALPPAA